MAKAMAVHSAKSVAAKLVMMEAAAAAAAAAAAFLKRRWGQHQSRQVAPVRTTGRFPGFLKIFDNTKRLLLSYTKHMLSLTRAVHIFPNILLPQLWLVMLSCLSPGTCHAQSHHLLACQTHAGPDCLLCIVSLFQTILTAKRAWAISKLACPECMQGQARNSSLNEDLGRVSYIFSDKTGKHLRF